MFASGAPAASAATPTAFFQDASIVGAGQTIVVSRVPVTNSSGKVTYFDLTIGFSVNGVGQLILNPDPPVPVPSVNLITSGFRTGTYTGINSNPVTVTGPGIGPGGQTSWSLAAPSGCANPPSATWYTGPIASNPLAARLQAAGITLRQYSYGVIGTGSHCDPYYWNGAGLIGLQQIGNTLSIASFTVNGSDKPIPQTTQTFTLRP